MLGYIGAVLISLVCLELIKLYPQHSILEFSSKILGTKLGKLVNIVLLWYAILIATYMLEQFDTLLTTMVYRTTPKFVFTIGILFLVLYVVHLGAEVIFRVSDVIFIAVVLVTLIIGIGLVKFLDLNLLLPVFTENVTNLLRATLAPFAFLGQIIIFLFFHHLVDDLSGIAKHIQLSLLLGMLLVIAFVIADLAVFGPELGSLLLFPPYMLIRYISIEAILDRIEILMLTIWIALAFLEVTAYFWISSQIIIDLFNLRSNNKLVINIPLAIILATLVDLQWSGISDFQDYSRGAYSMFLLLVEISIPLLLYLVAVIKGKLGGN